jgi:hypothetical protein
MLTKASGRSPFDALNRQSLSNDTMPQPIAIAIEGPNAGRALEELFAIVGIEGESQPVVERGEVYRDGGVLVAVGAIVGIVGGVAQIVSSIIDWRERWKKAHENKQLSVTIEDARGNRLALDKASPEQITAVLQTLAS